MKKHVLLVLSLILIFSLALPACGGGASKGPDVIKIGAIAESTGDIPAVGAALKTAAELAVKEVNDAGGLEVGGKKYKVELIIEDNGGSADKDAAAAEKLINQDNVLAIVGPNASRYAIPAAAAAEKAHVVLISPTSTNPKTTLDEQTGAPKKYVFRACFTDPFQGRVVANFALNNLGAAKAAVLFDRDSDYNRGIAEIFKQTFEKAGGYIVAYESYAQGAKDFTEQLGRIKSGAPDVIFLPNYYEEVPVQIHQAKAMGIQAVFLGSDTWGITDLIKLCGDECEGYYFSTHYAYDNPSEVAKQFISKYEAAYNNKPADVAALTHDSFGLLWQALQSAGRLDREALRNAMAKIPRYDGVTGTMQFNEGSGDPIKSAVILQVKGSDFVFFTNANP